MIGLLAIVAVIVAVLGLAEFFASPGVEKLDPKVTERLRRDVQKLINSRR